PDVERGDRVAALTEVELVVGDHVVEPAADEAERHRPDGDVADLPGLSAACHPALLAEPDGHDDAEDDRERVGAQRERPEVPDPLVGAGDRGKDHGAGLSSRSSRSAARSSARRPGAVPSVHTIGDRSFSSIATIWVPWLT